jgi:hypothetical protein
MLIKAHQEKFNQTSSDIWGLLFHNKNFGGDKFPVQHTDVIMTTK